VRCTKFHKKNTTFTTRKPQIIKFSTNDDECNNEKELRQEKLYDKMLSAKEESEESNEDEKNSDIDHHHKSTDESQKETEIIS